LNKFQKLSFSNVEEFLGHLPASERRIVERLRGIIFDCIPEVQEKLAYNVPFYYKRKRVCFIWPASVPWGKVKKEGVLFGLCRGNLIMDEINYFEKGDRKEIITKTFFRLNEIEEDLLKTFIFEAYHLDAETEKRE
jgi:hypothetical protein